MNAHDLLENKRERIYRHWLEMSYVTDTYEDHPSREWLDEHCVIKSIVSELPDDVDTVRAREAGCIELFHDFQTVQLNHDTMEPIELGHVWDFVTWEDSNNVDECCGPYDGLNECIEYAIEFSRENDLSILKFTSIASFDNLQYRSLADLDPI